MTQKITNCHTHIFKIDHVPEKFGRSIIAWPIYHILTIRVIKFIYRNMTLMGNRWLKRIWDRLTKWKLHTIRVLKILIIPWLVLRLIQILIRWSWDILTHFLRLELLLGPTSRELLGRYMILARYSAHYDSQGKIYNFLQRNYPVGTKMVVLTMDMEYMGAGSPKLPYEHQLKDLNRICKGHPELYPFIFADPRRIRSTSGFSGPDNYMNRLKNGLEDGPFKGIKIYPALGYYPFDKDLMEVYDLALAHNLPVMTHCSKGPVFYRGKKKKEWKRHEILEYPAKGGKKLKIPLPQTKNSEFTANFTHPLNFECLLNPSILSAYLGYDKDLSQLKICLGHFGGGEEWEKYDKDVFNYYNNCISHLSRQEYMQRPIKNTLTHGNKRTIWWNASWLSVIYDLMIRYENVYADISFTLHDDKMLPRLKFLLEDPKVRHRILFGTDFYMVSYKKLDKLFYQRIRAFLGKKLFDLIAVDNPASYLN